MNDADYENMSAFSCGVKALDDFFHFEVKECVLRRYLSAYTVFLDSGEIVAAFTLTLDLQRQTETEIEMVNLQ